MEILRLTAIEARKLSETTNNNPDLILAKQTLLSEEINNILLGVKVETKQGRFLYKKEIISEETLEKLRSMGYMVRKNRLPYEKEFFYTISW